jgi:pimeloyl-ACP methyl ester carboxylesterase/DNA-binding CsgD family transcriptional regulator
MMPRVRFASSRDGVSIAYATLGEGPPLVLMPALLFSHLEKLWELRQLRTGIERMAKSWTVVRYDNRGCGLSERDARDYSLEAHVGDLEAVADAAGLERFAINAPMLAGPVAIAFAAKHGERVTRLVLQSTIASSSEVASVQSQALLALLDMDWPLFTETAARVALQWSDEALARQAVPVLRECVAPEAARALLKAAVDFDVSGLLSGVKAPTLVIHNRQLPLDLAVSRSLAARIPNARLAVIDGFESVLSAAMEFLTSDGEPAAELFAERSFASDPAGLSRREIEVLRLVAAGKSNREIAEALVISTNTVDRHVSHILAKIGASNRAEAATYAAKQQLL